jgi:hypothetical protein
MHSEEPLGASELIKVMPTDKSIAEIYRKMTSKAKLEDPIPSWGDAIVWNELHLSSNIPRNWD